MARFRKPSPEQYKPSRAALARASRILPMGTPIHFGGSTVKTQSGIPLHILFVDGVLVEISPRLSDIASAKTETHSGLPYRHVLLNPLTGGQSLVDSRRAT